MFLLLALWLPFAVGCSRGFYRRQADAEVYGLVDCASGPACSTAGPFTIQPSPASRMFDPNCADCPPMPPDDPTSHQLMHCVDCKRGWPHWDDYGHTPLVENPAWTAHLPYDDEGTVVLDRDCAVELALLESREYQKELEDLYLSALSVTFERFRFDAQFFGGNSTFFTADGPARAGSVGSLLNTDTGLEMSKLFAGGGELLVGAANSLVWQFAGPDTYRANTLLDFSFVQPLLRAGGRAVVLERLTDAERALLANIRQMERFRRSFYTQTVIGRTPEPGPDPAGVGIVAVSGTAQRSVGGYLGLLEEQIQIRNLRSNVGGLRASLDRLIAFNEVGRISTYDVGLTRQRLYGEQGNLLAQNAAYQSTLDAYKVQLGLPPDLDVRIEDSFLRRFDLIDPSLTATQEAVAEFLDRLRNPEQDEAEDRESEYVETLASLRRRATEQLKAVAGDLDRLEEALPKRRKNLGALAKREEFGRGEIDPQIVSVELLDRRAESLDREFAVQAKKINATLDEIEPLGQNVPDDPDAENVWRAKLKDLTTRLSNELMELALIQAGARLDTITLSPIDLEPEQALDIARSYRRDWMNARAALVDAWRRIEVTGNDLLSDLDLTFEGDINTTDNNPLRFRGTTGRLRVGLEFDAPLTRLAERNVYRETLIEYQRTRRDFYAFEDRINQRLRDTIRAVRLNQLDFEVQRAAVFVAIARVDEAQMRLEQPPRGQGKAKLGANTARDVVDALASLLRAQNAFLGVWVNQEAQRLNLDLDLGTMQLDSCGQWIDPGKIDSDFGASGELDDALEFPDLEEIPPPEGMPTADDSEDTDAVPEPEL